MPARQAVAAQFLETRIAGAANGVALSTTAAFTAFVPGTNWFSLAPRNFATAVVARWRLCPYLVILKNQDALVTEPIDMSLLLQDGNTTLTNVMNSFDTLANGDALYFGSAVPFGGVWVNVVNANGTSNTIAVKYWNGALTAPSNVTDGTASGGASLAVDGSVTWTVPLDWVADSFINIFKPDTSAAWVTANHNHLYTDPMYWVRFDWSAAMDSTTSSSEMFGLNRSSAYAEMFSGEVWEASTHNTPGRPGFAGVEALSDAGTANLIVTCAAYGKFGNVAQVAA